MNKKIFTNIVEEKEMREIQARTLKILRDALKKSFGPYGSNTTITKVEGDRNNIVVSYTKDGHKILSSLMFQDVIETSVKDIVETVTRNIVVKVGDGTTSAVILSSIIFDKLIELNKKDITPYELISDFKAAVKDIKNYILDKKQEFTPQTAYDIAYISTNGNVQVAENIKKIYEENGNDVYIDVTTSPTQDNMLRVYDGVTLETGYSDTAYINTNKGTSRIENPLIYMFDDPIDTPQMGGFFDAIISTNILKPYHEGKYDEIKPTVILAPRVSRDFSAYIEVLCKHMYSIENPMHRPPLLVITNINDYDTFSDLGQLCGCKSIKKYINPEQYKKDVESGLAPTPETVVDFCGSADLVEADSMKTKFINPKFMYKPGTTEYSDVFNNLISFLETELKTAVQNTTDSLKKYKLKKRIQSLKANLVEYLVGGISPADRDALKDLVEDAVKNCMSAAKNGVGYGANFEGLRAAFALLGTTEKYQYIIEIIYDAYIHTILELYKVSGIPNDEADEIMIKLMTNKNRIPYNVKTKKFDDKVLSSIDSDICILDSISKLITLMITTNQFLVPDFIYNKYMYTE